MSFFNKLWKKFKGKKQSQDFEDSLDDSFEFTEMSTEQQDVDIEQQLENRPDSSEFPSPPSLQFDEDFDDLEEDQLDSAPEVFQMTEEKKLELDELEGTTEQKAPQGQTKSKQLTEDRPIDIEAIKNYRMTEEDEREDDESEFEHYQEFSPAHETPGLTRSQKILFPLIGLLRKINPFYKNNNNKPHPKSGPGITSKIPNWDGVIETVFSTRSRAKVHHIFLFTLVIGSTYALGTIMAIILKGPPNTQPPSALVMSSLGEQKNYSSGISQVRSNNLFNAKLDERQEVEDVIDEPEPIDMNLICDSASRSSRLPITLINTVVLQDAVKSIASVQVRGSRDLKNFREGEKINEMAEVSRINRMKMILKNLETGECEYVATQGLEEQMQQPSRQRTPIVSPEEGQRLMESTRDDRIINEGDSFQIDRSVRDEMLGNINEVLTQARAVQIRNPDGSYSFKMTEIVPGSIYTQLGIQNDDIITGINGDKITNINELMSMFGRIRDIDNFEIQVQRDGSDRSLRYEFE